MRNPPVIMGPRAERVLRLGLQGFSDKEIARRLGMTPATVRTHFARLYVERGPIGHSLVCAVANQRAPGAWAGAPPRI